MEVDKGAGILSIILGLVFILFPMFSSELVSIIVGLSLLFFGICSVYLGYDIGSTYDMFSKATIIIGIIAIIFGFLFIFYIDALSFLVGIQFYNNKDLVLNSISYLTNRKDTLTIRKNMSSVTYTATELENRVIQAIIITIPIINNRKNIYR